MQSVTAPMLLVVFVVFVFLCFDIVFVQTVLAVALGSASQAILEARTVSFGTIITRTVAAAVDLGSHLVELLSLADCLWVS